MSCPLVGRTAERSVTVVWHMPPPCSSLPGPERVKLEGEVALILVVPPNKNPILSTHDLWSHLRGGRLDHLYLMSQLRG